MKPKFYEANLSINCVDGATEGIIASDPLRIYDYLHEHDHEGSSLHMSVRWTPETMEHYDDAAIIYELVDSWQS